MLARRHQKAQATLEYLAMITVVAAALAAVVYLRGGEGTSIFQQKVEGFFTSVADKIDRDINNVFPE